MFDIYFSNNSNTGEFRLELLYTRPYIVIMFLHQKHRQESSLPDYWRHFIFSYSIKYAKPLSLPLTPARVSRNLSLASLLHKTRFSQRLLKDRYAGRV